MELDLKPSYDGRINSTLTGLSCQRWDSQSPHKHHYNDPSFFPDTTHDEIGNYCRTPDGSEWPWCFTTSPDVRSEACNLNIRLCSNGQTSGTGHKEKNRCYFIRFCKSNRVNFS